MTNREKYELCAGDVLQGSAGFTLVVSNDLETFYKSVEVEDIDIDEVGNIILLGLNRCLTKSDLTYYEVI